MWGLHVISKPPTPVTSHAQTHTTKLDCIHLCIWPSNPPHSSLTDCQVGSVRLSPIVTYEIRTLYLWACGYHPLPLGWFAPYMCMCALAMYVCTCNFSRKPILISASFLFSYEAHLWLIQSFHNHAPLVGTANLVLFQPYVTVEFYHRKLAPYIALSFELLKLSARIIWTNWCWAQSWSKSKNHLLFLLPLNVMNLGGPQQVVVIFQGKNAWAVHSNVEMFT